MTVFGTRPEAIKMAPIVRGLKADPTIKEITVLTGQHKEMLTPVLDIFGITADYNLNVMEPNQTLTAITARVLERLESIIVAETSDMVLVHGDTTSTLAASLAAFYQHVPLGHVEAGLRTWDVTAPFPEELNRQLTDRMASLYFAPTSSSRENLLYEHVASKDIYVTGNTAIDALNYTVQQTYQHPVLSTIPSDDRIILLTMHRRENLGNPMENVFRAIRNVVSRHPDLHVVYPVHLNPAVQRVAHEVFDEQSRIHLTAPLNVVDFHNLMARSYFIMTDSGGVQEEAPALNKPVLVLRDKTERPEGVKAGTLRLVGRDYQGVQAAMEDLLLDQQLYAHMAAAKNPYGDGRAAQRIIDAIKERLN
ncbi:non-hydrolyzing UDP-N-acetylglucosamine 2-epimerase [Weissella halotolerans]|uniref:UDP-N-acetylglucosamine 2-epimerase (non-hydrolyzing) n=1 Tax=Weissella halotolerans DSM 20190 TaxID=1123500 RepID=A0A0R2G7Q7_9LACO|nr:UDP-N-acetylglucosamine 2-epimerase (non-hydrolyzing) [Weissella halotolerans]KRN33511.1 UDP-N-acetylglucosamine 2-epimerase [Weissella halotolerans DSM 20190]